MKKRILSGVIFLILAITSTAYANNARTRDISGRWAEQISQRVVMDIFPDDTQKNYQIFITWREDNLAQKDIYRFSAKDNGKGVLEYKNGLHIYRYFDSKNKIEDKTDYKDGSGTIKITDDTLVWTDNKDGQTSTFIRAGKELSKDTIVKNKLFSVSLPEELRGLYRSEVKKDRISFYHKESEKAGFGGFAFAIRAYKNPADHAVLPGSKKIGELTDKKGTLYDIVLKHPTDVQYDYTKGPEAPDTFKILYNIGDVADIKDVKGTKYHKAQGTKGENLYKDTLRKHIELINKNLDSNSLENENVSYMYNVLAQENKNILDKIGYTYYDLNADGIDELIIGEIADGEWKGIIYDIYTMVNRKPKHVVSGGARNRYYACDDTFVCNEYSSGAGESGLRVYNLVENSTELYPQVSFKYDIYANNKKPWFISYGSDIRDEKWENMDEKEIKERKSVFERYERFDYIPLSTIK